MAVIVLTPSKKTMKKSRSFGIGYITREDKAYKTLFLDCTEKNYDKDFQEQFNCRNTNRKDCRTFYHIKQSFDVSDKVDKDIAFEIAKEISFHYLDKGYQVVCATHTDTDHLHNHIIFSSVDCAGNMFKDTKADLKELTNLHDKIMQRYGFKTQEDLKKEKLISRKENLEENKLKNRGIFTNKELITYAIDKVVEDKDVKNIYDFVKELNKRYKIHCYFRGSFINFEIDGKKYRGVNLGNSYSLASIKRKVSGKYNEKDIIENLVKDLQKTVNSKEEFLRELKENRVTFEETTGDIIFRLNGKETSLKNFSMYDKKQFYREILLNKLKADLKLDIYKITSNNKIDSLEKWIEEIKKLNYIDDVKIQDNTVLILSGNLKLDIKKLGYGSDEKNRFSLENIKKNLFIKRLGEELKHQVRNEKVSSEKDILNFLSQKNIAISGQGKNLYIRYENQDINLKRFIVLDRELRKMKISKFFIAFRKIKNLKEFENISGIKKINDSYFYHDIDLSTIK
ncbi:MAG: relaxase/mobilization nuclease domain-containing protein, partial [Filifactor alocis]|uniref:relaxase/mobilization nuclease domain-containing protein n=1 Tax=Filifactor alocis TaxID=143361 RepID=UPI003FA16138